jgi:hypothetical protein
MTLKEKVFAGVALISLFVSVGYIFGQAPASPKPADAAEPAAPAAAPATRPAPSVLTVVPADAWGVIAVNNMEQLDSEVMRLGQKLGLPIFFAPSGLIQMGLGITQGFNPAGGIAVIVLNGTKYPGAAGWSMASGLPVPVVLALAASDAQALIQSLNGKPTEGDETISSVTLQKEPVFAAVKDGYVLIGPDADVLKDLTAKGAAATQMAMAVLKPGFVRYVTSSNLFVYVNARPVLATYGPMLKGLLAFAAAAAQSAQGEQGPGAAAGPAMATMLSTYIDILTKQLDKALLFASLAPDGLHVSGLVTFQPDTLLAKVFAAAKPSGAPLLAGLPGGTFVLAAGSEQTGQQYAKPLADLFAKPYLEAMRESGNPALMAAATQQAKTMDVRIELAKLQQAGQAGLYVLPKTQEATVGLLLVGQFSDAAKAYDLIKQIVKSQIDLTAEQQPKVKEFLDLVTYTPDVETVEGAKVDTLLVDMTKLPEVLSVPEDKVAEAMKAVKVLLGPDGLKARIAVTDRDIMLTLGGGQAFLKEALLSGKAGKAPLATQPAVTKVNDYLPRERLGVLYLSVENLLHVVDRIGKAVADEGLPFQVGPTSSPLVAALISDPLGLHGTLYVPTELAVSIKGMVMQSMMQQRAAASTRPAPKPEPAPAPEF